MATNVVVIGPPGAGKGTRISQAKEIIPNLVSISTGNLVRKKGVDTSSGGLISDDIIMEMLKEEIGSLKDNQIVILDGVPRTVKQAEMMKDYGIIIDRIIYLPISEETAIARATDRLVCSNSDCQEPYTEKSNFKSPKKKGFCDKCGSTLIRRADDNAETAAQRIRVYMEKTYPVLDWYKKQGVPVFEIEIEDHNCLFTNAVTG